MKASADEILKAHGLKNTRQRQVVLGAFTGSNRAFSQPELEKQLKGEMDRVTLYRILNSFEEKGILHSILDQDGTMNYASCSDSCSAGQHHDQHIHFNCRKCKNVYCLPSPNPVVHVPDSFKAENLSVIAIGLCDACNQP